MTGLKNKLHRGVRFFFEGLALPCGSQVCCRERAVGVMAPTFVAASECAMNTRCVFVLPRFWAGFLL